MSCCWFLLVQISGQKMKPEFKKVFHFFEELEEAGESATLTISPGVASVPAGSHCPLHILPSLSPNSGRSRVVSCVGRLEVPTFSNLDGAPPPSLPCSPSPSTSGGWPPTKEEVVKYQRMMSKEDKCCLCEFKISDPNPQEGRLCGLLESMWNHIEECHSEEEDWFDETFSSQFLDV